MVKCIYYENGKTTYYSPYFDLEGNPVERTKDKYPYSYSSYVVWKNGYNKENSHTLHSDRLHQWDYKKYNKYCEEIWGNQGQYFDDRKPEDIEKFLIKYLGKQIKLTAIMESCNVSSGFPYWTFIYEEVQGEC